MFKRYNRKVKRKRAQAVIEACIAFVLIFLVFISMVEFALYFQNVHANQTLSDDINANLSPYTRDLVCTEPDLELLNLIEKKAKRYLEKDIELNIDKQNDDVLILKSDKKSIGRDILTVKINCADLNTGYIVRTSYLYRGFFALKTGIMISAISSLQTPRF